MAKWLTIEERLNANFEYNQIKEELKDLREIRRYYKKIKNIECVEFLNQQISEKQKRRERLCQFIYHSKKSKHNGLFGIDGDIYKTYGKLRRELSKEELREYMKIKKREHRSKQIRDTEPHSNSLTRKMFGIALKDMTPEQRKEYDHEIYLRRINRKRVFYER